MANGVTRGGPDAPPPLDPGVLQVIRESAAWLAGQEDSFARQLQAGIVALIPELAAGGQVLCERLVRSLLWTATAGPAAARSGGRAALGRRAEPAGGFPRGAVCRRRAGTGPRGAQRQRGLLGQLDGLGVDQLLPLGGAVPGGRRQAGRRRAGRGRAGRRRAGRGQAGGRAAGRRRRPRPRRRHRCTIRTAPSRWPPTWTWRRWRACSMTRTTTRTTSWLRPDHALAVTAPHSAGGAPGQRGAARPG